MTSGWLHRFRAFFPFLMAVTVLIILNGSAWWAYRLASGELKDNFQRSVFSFSKHLARQVEIAYREDLERNLFVLEKDVESSDSFDPIESLVPDFEVWLQTLPPEFLVDLSPGRPIDPLFHDLYLIGRRGELIQTWAGEIGPDTTPAGRPGIWEIHPLLSGDRQEIIQAIQNSETVLTEEEVEVGGFFLTCYSPVVFNGVCRGLVGVRANILFTERLQSLRQGLMLAVAVGSFLILGLALMFYRVLQQLDRVQLRMAHRERLAQLGQMVSIVAHEIRNPLGIIEQTSDLIRKRYSPKEGDPLLGYISEEVERLNRLVNRFLEFARPSGQTGTHQGEKTCDLGQGIREIHSAFLPQAEKKGIRLVYDIPEELPKVQGLDREQLKQILLNLVLNAFDATPSGKSVTLVGAQEGHRVCMRVIDEGTGMSQEQIEKATDPFYTNKEKGSGLGLALVAKIVEEAGGELEFQSNPGSGTEVTVSFKY